MYITLSCVAMAGIKSDYIYIDTVLSHTRTYTTRIYTCTMIYKNLHHAKLESSIMSYKLHKFATMVYMS